MKLTRNSIAATIAALLIGGIAASPASAAVRNEISQFDINEQVYKFERKDDFERNIEPPFNTDHITPDGKTRTVLTTQSGKKANEGS